MPIVSRFFGCKNNTVSPSEQPPVVRAGTSEPGRHDKSSVRERLVSLLCCPALINNICRKNPDKTSLLATLSGQMNDFIRGHLATETMAFFAQRVDTLEHLNGIAVNKKLDALLDALDLLMVSEHDDFSLDKRVSNELASCVTGAFVRLVETVECDKVKTTCYERLLARLKHCNGGMGVLIDEKTAREKNKKEDKGTNVLDTYREFVNIFYSSDFLIGILNRNKTDSFLLTRQMVKDTSIKYNFKYEIKQCAGVADGCLLIKESLRFSYLDADISHAIKRLPELMQVSGNLFSACVDLFKAYLPEYIARESFSSLVDVCVKCFLASDNKTERSIFLLDLMSLYTRANVSNGCLIFLNREFIELVKGIFVSKKIPYTEKIEIFSSFFNRAFNHRGKRAVCPALLAVLSTGVRSSDDVNAYFSLKSAGTGTEKEIYLAKKLIDRAVGIPAMFKDDAARGCLAVLDLYLAKYNNEENNSIVFDLVESIVKNFKQQQGVSLRLYEILEQRSDGESLTDYLFAVLKGEVNNRGS